MYTFQVLFLGPLSLHYLDGVFKIYFGKFFAVVFRVVKNDTCMLPLLVRSFGESCNGRLTFVICSSV